MSTVHKQVRLSTAELHELKQLMGALLALLSFWSLASLDLGRTGMLLLGSVVAVVAFGFPRWTTRIPASAWRWAGPCILFIIGADFMLHIPQFIPPLVRMVVLLIIYRLLAQRNHREDLQLILLCLFCVVISGVLTVSLLFAFQILIFTPLAMALLFVVCILDRGNEATPYVLSWEHFKWSRFISRVWCVLDLRIVALCSLMFVLVVAVSSLLFILTPRFDFNQTIPFLEISTSARSGFSEDVKLGAVSEIQEDNSEALRVDVPSFQAIAETPYWRMLALDKYEKGRFRMSQSLRGKPFRKFEEVREIRSPTIPMEARKGDLWTVYMEGGISRYLPVPGDFVALRFQKYQDTEMVPAVRVIGLDTVGQNVFSYQFEDLKFDRRFEAISQEVELFATSPIAAASDEPLTYPLTTLELDLAEDSLQMLSEINQVIQDGESMNAVAYSQAATNYLWSHFTYSLQPNGVGDELEDPVAQWLKAGSQGHCELFAGSFVLLARQAGFPARMVVGFAGGSWNSVEDYFVVRNRDAHAWVEIYDAAEENWLRVDPTPGSGSSNPEVVVPANIELESGWDAWMDSLRIQWYRRIVNFEQKDQVELAMTLKQVFQDYVASFKEWLARLGGAIKAWGTRPLDFMHVRLLSLLLGISALLYFSWRGRYQVMALLFRVLRRPQALDPVRRQASRYLKRLDARGVDSSVVEELQALRFGPASSIKAAKPIFAKARRALKA